VYILCSESKITDNPGWFCDDRIGLTDLVKVFGVLKQGADFDVRFYTPDLSEFNSGFILEECNILETRCYVQCVKNRIQKLGTGLFTLRSIWCMQFGVRMSICMEAVRSLHVIRSESSVAVWDELVGDLDITLYVNSESNITILMSMLQIATVHNLLSHKDTMKWVGVLILK